MSADWQELLFRIIDEDGPSDGEAHALAEALDDRGGRREAAEWLAFEAQMQRSIGLQSEVSLALSREKLLAKAVLLERSRAVRSDVLRLRAIMRRVVASAMAAAVVLCLVAWWVFQERYPLPRVEGDFQISRAGERVDEARTLCRGDRVRVGAGGATLLLGDYCEVDLAGDTDVVVSGEPRKEGIELKQGKAHCRVAAQEGEFSVLTPRGSVAVVGTEFVTTVEYVEEKGDSAMEKPKRSAVVTVMVLSGVVAYYFGDVSGELGIGMSKVFAGEEAGDSEPVRGIPTALKGFQGMMAGKLVKKAEKAFLFKAEKIKRVWKGNRAEKPQDAIGLTFGLSLTKLTPHHGERIWKNYRGLKVGDAIELEAFDLGGDLLFVKEWLRKVETDGEERK